MSKQNLSESLAQYSVRSFATFLAEQPMMASRGVGGGGNGGGKGGGNGKSTPITDHGTRGPYVQTAGGGKGKGDGGWDGGYAPGGQLWSTYIISAWGSDNMDADLNGDGVIDGADLTIALGRDNTLAG